MAIDNEMVIRSFKDPVRMKSLGKTLKRKNIAPGQDPNDLDLTKKIFVKHCSTAEVNRKF